MPEDSGWRFRVFGRDNGKVVSLLEVGRGGEKGRDRELTRG